MTASFVTHDAPVDVGRTYSLLVPLLLAVIPFLTLPIGENFSFYNSWMVTERGAIEHATVFFSAVGFVIALLIIRSRALSPSRWIAVLMGFFALGFLYIAGEEISWGQHLFNWGTPEWLAEKNRQSETNIHNLHLSVDRIPKTVIGVVIALTGLAWPIYSHFSGRKITNTEGDWYWLWPTAAVRPTAALFLIVWLLDRYLVLTDFGEGEDYTLGFSEHRELMMVYFLALYCGSIYRRLQARKEGLI